MPHRAVFCEKIGKDATKDHLKLKMVQEDSDKIPEGYFKIKVLACGLSLVDLLQCEGKHVFKRQAPYIPGLDVVGRIVEIGGDSHTDSDNDSLNKFHKNDLIFGMVQDGGVVQEGGGLSDYTLISSESAYKLKVNPNSNYQNFDPLILSGLEMNYGTMYHGLVDLAKIDHQIKTQKISKSPIVLILGASGGIGMATIDICKGLFGAKIIACASSKEKLEYCKNAGRLKVNSESGVSESGSDVLIRYESSDSNISNTAAAEQDFKKALKKSGYYGQIDIVVDPIGGPLAQIALNSLGFGGRYLVVGFAAGGLQPESQIPKFPLNQILLNERRIIGVLWGGWKMLSDENMEKNRKNIDVMVDSIAKGKMTGPQITWFTLEEYQEAFKVLRERNSLGKICIRMNAESQTKTKSLSKTQSKL